MTNIFFRQWAPSEQPFIEQFTNLWEITNEYFGEFGANTGTEIWGALDRDIILGQVELTVTRLALAMAETDWFEFARAA